jgi:hypothetical protein
VLPKIDASAISETLVPVGILLPIVTVPTTTIVPVIGSAKAEDAQPQLSALAAKAVIIDLFMRSPPLSCIKAPLEA